MDSNELLIIFRITNAFAELVGKLLAQANQTDEPTNEELIAEKKKLTDKIKELNS